MFAHNSVDDVRTYVVLSSYIKLFDNILNGSEKLTKYVNRAEEKDCEFTASNTLAALRKMTYLRQAYAYDLEHMNDITWEKCCETTILKLNYKSKVIRV